MLVWSSSASKIGPRTSRASNASFLCQFEHTHDVTSTLGPRGETLAVLYVVLTWWWMVLLHQKCFFFFFNLLLLPFYSILRGGKQTWNLGNLFWLHTHSLIRSSPRWVSRHPAWAWISTSLDQPAVGKSGKWTPFGWESRPGKSPKFFPTLATQMADHALHPK